MEMTEQELKLRLEGISGGLKRSRLSFIVAIIISLGMLIAGYNAYLSWYRQFALREKFDSSSMVTEAAQRQLLSEWVKSRIISISFLGIQVGISDASLLGAISLCVSALWFFFSVRRDNHNIGLLLLETENSRADIHRIVFREIVSYFVFIQLTAVEQPIRDLQPRPVPADPDRREGGIYYLLASLLYFLPPIAVFALLGLDAYSLFEKPVFHFPHTPLIQSLTSWGAWIEVLGRSLATLVFGLLALRLAIQTFQFENATRRIMILYGIRHALLLAAGPPSDAETPAKKESRIGQEVGQVIRVEPSATL
jgi:hypothetical protein